MWAERIILATLKKGRCGLDMAGGGLKKVEELRHGRRRPKDGGGGEGFGIACEDEREEREERGIVGLKF